MFKRSNNHTPNIYRMEIDHLCLSLLNFPQFIFLACYHVQSMVESKRKLMIL